MTGRNQFDREYSDDVIAVAQDKNHIELMRTVSKLGFVQKYISRSEICNRDDSYTIWRRFNNGRETWLSVVWHKNWDKGRKDSTQPIFYQASDGGIFFIQSWLCEDVCQWLKGVLHHAGIFIDDAVDSDFECLQNDLAFNL